MKLEYKNPTLEYSIESIMQFHDGTQSEYWTETLFYFYPQIDKTMFQNIEVDKRKEYLRDILSKVILTTDLDKKITEYQTYWNANVISEI